MGPKRNVCPFILMGLAANPVVVEHVPLDEVPEEASACRGFRCQLWWACQEPAADRQGGLRSLADMLDEVIAGMV